MNGRIKEARKALNLSQEAFGERIGLSKFAISGYESGKRKITDRSVSDICREFGINEDWLRNGAGEMFTYREHGAIVELVERYNLDDFAARALLAYQKLTPNNRAAIKNYLISVVSSYGAEAAQEIAPEVVIDGKTITDPDIVARLISYNREIEDEKLSGGKLLVSPMRKDV